MQRVLGFELGRQNQLVIDYKHKSVQKFLKQVQAEEGADTAIGRHIEAILSGRMAKEWEQKGPSPYRRYLNTLYYGEEETTLDTIYQKFVAMLGQAAQEFEQYMCCPWNLNRTAALPIF